MTAYLTPASADAAASTARHRNPKVHDQKVLRKYRRHRDGSASIFWAVLLIDAEGGFFI